MQYLQFRYTELNWVIFYTLVIFSWILVFFMILASDGVKSVENFYGSELLATLCQPIYDINDWPYAFLMWGIMGIAMMVPTIFPTLKTYDDLVKSVNLSNLGFTSIMLGFILIWVIFSIFASLLQIYLTHISIVDANGVFISIFPSAILLILAGLYQLSYFKRACLNRCRHPLVFFLKNWNDSFKHSFFLGFKIGMYCFGCCWLIMLLAFVGGVMNIGFMAIATLAMVAEKLPKYGRYVTLPLSGLLLISGSLIVISNLS